MRTQGAVRPQLGVAAAAAVVALLVAPPCALRVPGVAARETAVPGRADLRDAVTETRQKILDHSSDFLQSRASILASQQASRPARKSKAATAAARTEISIGSDGEITQEKATDVAAAPTRILITGITGMIGSNIASAAIEDPWCLFPHPDNKEKPGEAKEKCGHVKVIGLVRFRSNMRNLRGLLGRDSLVTEYGDVTDPFRVYDVICKNGGTL